MDTTGRPAKVTKSVNARYDDRSVAGLLQPGTPLTVYGEPFTTEDGARLYIDPPRRHVWVANIEVDAIAEFRLIWPIKGVAQIIGQVFGANPQNYAKFGLPGHEGVDCYAPLGTEIVAAADGTVKLAAIAAEDYPDGPAYGNQVRLTHVVGSNTYETIYAHLRDIVAHQGDVVKTGDLLGRADDTGNSFGSHLHLTLKRKGATAAGYKDGAGRAWPFDIIDPSPFLPGT